MAAMRYYQKEITYTVVAFLFLWFTLTNVNSKLSTVYLFAGLISIVLLMIDLLVFDKNVQITYEKKPGSFIETIFAALAGWVLLLIISYVVLNFKDGATSISSVLVSINAANPVFSNSKILTVIILGPAVGYIETQFISRVFAFLQDRFRIRVDRSNMFSFSFILAAIFVSGFFLILHFTAKGITNIPALITVFIMAFISFLMIAYFNGETKQAIWLHIIANSAAGILLLLSGGNLALGSIAPTVTSSLIPILVLTKFKSGGKKWEKE